jgi:hypothetical protein
MECVGVVSGSGYCWSRCGMHNELNLRKVDVGAAASVVRLNAMYGLSAQNGQDIED